MQAAQEQQQQTADRKDITKSTEERQSNSKGGRNAGKQQRK